MAMAKQKKFKFPPEILEKINECSYGGFLLFNFDEDGDVQTFGSFDDKLALSAMEKYLMTWAKTLEAYEIDELFINMKKASKRRGKPPTEEE
jgi:hypothetical protein